MKKKILIVPVLYILMVTGVTAQSVQYKYCRITVEENKRGNSNKINNNEIINIDFGKRENFNGAEDTTEITKLEKVKTFTNTIDALDYLNSFGWEYVNTVCPVGGFFRGYNYLYIVRKKIETKDFN